MNANPVVSVLMPFHNSGRYLDEAIRSVLSQETDCVWELLLINDGSSDGSDEIARQYATRYPDQIRVFEHPGGENRGISASRNLGLTHARGELAGFLDSDDVWLPHHLETLRSILLRNPEAAAAYAGAERWVWFDQPFDCDKATSAWWGQNYLPPLVPEHASLGLLPPGRLLEWFLQDESMVPCICSMLIRTKAAHEINGFVDEFEGLYDDQVFHAKLSLQYFIYAENICVARYRQHKGSCCAAGREDRVASGLVRKRFLALVQQYRDDLETSRFITDVPEARPAETLEACMP